MISVKAPDGSIVQFPDGTSDDVMAKAMREAFPPTDPVKAEVSKELADMRKAGVPVGDGMSRSVLQGATFGFGDEILAGLSTPLEMMKRRTLSPSKAYGYAKAREDLLLEEARKKNGLVGMGAEALGGLASGGALARGGMTLLKPGAGLLPNAGRAAAEGAAYGGVIGAGEGSGSGRATDALKGAALGGVLGGGLGLAPAVVKAGKVAATPITSYLSARANPQGYAAEKLAQAATRAGKTPTEIARELFEAGKAGQPYTVADALGTSGQRLMSGVTRSPGEGRTAATNFLEARQADQATRIADILSQNVAKTNRTAAATKGSLEGLRSAIATRNYDAARGSAGAVDVSKAIGMIDDKITPGVNKIVSPQSGIADDTIEGVLRRAKSFLTDGKSVLTDFNKVLQRKKELDALIERASNAQKRELIPVRNAVDDALAKASDKYAKARDTFRRQSTVIDAIEKGQEMAKRGRVDDNIAQFGKMRPLEQNAARIGYVDTKLAKVERAAGPTVNRARDFTSLTASKELPVFAQPGRADLLARALNRENTMHKTMTESLYGSKTADNFADQAELGAGVAAIGKALGGSPISAAKDYAANAFSNMTGNTPAVREALAKMLIATEPRAAGQLAKTLKAQLVKQGMSDKKAAQIVSNMIAGSAPAQNRLTAN